MTLSAEVVALIAAAVAVFAAVIAVRATAVLARTMLAHEADRRGQAPGPGAPGPALTGRVGEGHTRRGVGEDTREYAFVLALTNASSTERCIDGAALRVTYRTRANFLGAVDLTANEQVTVPAGQTVNQTLRFSTSNVIPRHCRIDAYTLLLTADRGERLVIDASLPEVLRADTDGVGPTSWGWD